eukprot:gene9581-12905_t
MISSTDYVTCIITKLIDFDDGHHPGGCHNIQTKLAMHYNKNNNSDQILVVNDVLPDDWCTKCYDYAIEKNKPWGVYVTTEDALNSFLSSDELWETNPEKALALIATRSLVFNAGKSLVGPDYNAIHGTAVWCLTSDISDSVNYHIDYAELYRYETNEIHPPLYAGTCHVSPISSEVGDIKGGEFRVNKTGLDHYRKYGYKGRLSNSIDMELDFTSNDWITIPYRHNQGIFHDGTYPHLSTEITYIKPSMKRVILGFNCFTSELSECNLRAPEHSDAFNRTIKLYQTIAGLGMPITSNSSKYKLNTSEQILGKSQNNHNNIAQKEDDHLIPESVKNDSIIDVPPKKTGGISFNEVKKNPALCKLLVFAARKLKNKEITKNDNNYIT